MKIFEGEAFRYVCDTRTPFQSERRYDLPLTFTLPVCSG